MNYEQLVKALRETATFTKFDDLLSKREQKLESLAFDAADAIEALLAELSSVIADAGARIGKAEAEVKRLEPKRGKWTEIEDYDGDFHYQCSVCGEEWYFIDGTPADNNANYCPHCGAKMEVQE